MFGYVIISRFNEYELIRLKKLPLNQETPNFRNLEIIFAVLILLLAGLLYFMTYKKLRVGEPKKNGFSLVEALVAFRLANKRFKADSIIIYGRSFGTGIASQLATMVDCRRLILETPYYSIPALFSYYAPIYPTSYMSKLKLPVNEYLKDVTVPVTIFHGTDDGVIPYSVTKKLKEVLKPTDEFITIEKGRHNNLGDFILFHQKLDSLLSK